MECQLDKQDRRLQINIWNLKFKAMSNGLQQQFHF